MMVRKRTILVAASILAAVLAGIWYGWSKSASDVWADPSNQELVRLGAARYQSQCASCHGANLEGEANWRSRRPDGSLPAPPHGENGHTWHHSDEILFGITKHGGQRNAPAGFVSRMPGFAGTMSDKQIHAVLAYIKSRWPEAVRARQEWINARSR
jgi:mono/diheme cytochrome c family protein